MDMLQEYRTNMTYMESKTLSDAKDMLGCVSRVYAQLKEDGQTMRDTHTLSCAGRVEGYKHFRQNTTKMNLARLAVMEKLTPGIEGIFSRSLAFRDFSHINMNLGIELTRICEDADGGWVISHSEATRWNTLRLRNIHRQGSHNMKPTRCGFQNTCRDGEFCKHLHMVRERECDAIYTRQELPTLDPSTM